MSRSTLKAAVRASVRAGDRSSEPAAGALVALAERYAEAIDDAGRVAAEVEAFDGSALGHNDRVSLAALRRRVGEAETLAALGPKLLDALRALGLTDAALLPSRRPGDVVVAPSDALARLRAGRLARPS